MLTPLVRGQGLDVHPGLQLTMKGITTQEKRFPARDFKGGLREDPGEGGEDQEDHASIDFLHISDY